MLCKVQKKCDFELQAILFLSMSKRVTKLVDGETHEREGDCGGRRWTLWESREAWNKGDDCVRSEGAICLIEWLLLSDQKCTSWKCSIQREGPCDPGWQHTDHTVLRRQCGARPHDLPPREAIVLQQVPLFISYRQDRQMNVTRGVLIHHEMPINQTSATKQGQTGNR